MNTKNNILITGPPSSGKTTVIKKIIGLLPRNKKGFYTVEEKIAGRRVGFMMHTLDGYSGYLAHENIESDYSIRRFGVSIENIEEIAVPSIQPVANYWIILDEIGKMECFSQAFIDTTRQALNSSNTVIGTISYGEKGFIQEVKKRNDVEIIEVTPENRNLLPHEIVEKLCQIR